MTRTKELIDMLSEYGIDASDCQAKTMLTHLELLLQKNSVMNLTRIDSIDEGLVTHIVDSLLPLPYLRGVFKNHRVSFVDVGTGGGFPGLPLACMTDWNAVLIDSVAKKVNAVKEFTQHLGLSERVQCIQIRAEDLARQQPEQFDLVVTRAVAQTNVLLEYASPLLKDSGYLVVYKARPSEDEIEAGTKACRLCGMSLVSRETFELPKQQGHREFLYYKKTGKARVRLPRRNGLAKNEPLGL